LLARVERRIERAARIGVEHELRRERGARGARKLDAVELRSGERLLVGQDLPLAERHRTHQGEEALSHEPLAPAWRLEALRVAEQRGLALAHQHALLLPAQEQ